MSDTLASPYRNRELRFLNGSIEAYLDALATLPSGQTQTRVWIMPSSAEPTLADELKKRADPGCSVRIAPAPKVHEDTTSVIPQDFHPDVVLVLESDPARLSAQLARLIDEPVGLVIAPQTAHHWSQRPLYLISIPKSGTHLLYELANTFGYYQGISCAHEARPAHWYCVEYTNSHTVARDFFVDTVRRQPFGNRHHPFMRAPALFIYRNPLDVLVSEANYYHLPGKTSFADYLSHRSFTERLEVLLGQDWLLGSLRERIGGFLPWMHFTNVAAVSFEELVGSQGGGDDQIQADTIWSLQLKLHIPGKPADFASKLFNRESATFNEGRIGSYADKIPPHTLSRFFSQPQDFMHELGYTRPASTLRRVLNSLLRRLSPRLLARREIARIPLHADRLRKRPLSFSGNAFDNTQIPMETDFLGYNIIRLRGRFLGVPQSLGAVDLDACFDELPPEIIFAGSTTRVKFKIMQHLNL